MFTLNVRVSLPAVEAMLMPVPLVILRVSAVSSATICVLVSVSTTIVLNALIPPAPFCTAKSDRFANVIFLKAPGSSSQTSIWSTPAAV